MQETRGFLEKVYRGSLGMMVNAMVADQALSEQEIQELYVLLLHTAQHGNDNMLIPARLVLQTGRQLGDRTFAAFDSMCYADQAFFQGKDQQQAAVCVMAAGGGAADKTLGCSLPVTSSGSTKSCRSRRSLRQNRRLTATIHTAITPMPPNQIHRRISSHVNPTDPARKILVGPSAPPIY